MSEQGHPSITGIAPSVASRGSFQDFPSHIYIAVQSGMIFPSYLHPRPYEGDVLSWKLCFLHVCSDSGLAPPSQGPMCPVSGTSGLVWHLAFIATAVLGRVMLKMHFAL